MNLVEKCRKAVEKISREKGGFTLFALFEHEETPGKWELLFSAPWLKPGRLAIQTIVDALVPELSSEDWQSIVSIIPLDPSLEYVRWIARRYNVENGAEEVFNALLDGVLVTHGFIITAKALPTEMSRRQAVAA